MARRILSKSVSRKYITGDGFRSICEASISDLSLLDSQEKLENLTSAKSVFIKGDIYDQVVAAIGDFMDARVVLVGNSDRDFTDPTITLPRNAKRVYFQNLQFAPTSRVGLLPLGIENLSLARNSLPFVLGLTQIRKRRSKSRALLIGPFSPTDPERQDLLNIDIRLLPNSDLFRDLISPREYIFKASKYKYIAAPRGNGTDTHRFWETLYLNSFPIVKDSQWSRNIQSLGFPCVVVADWTVESIQLAISRFESNSTFANYADKLDLLYWTKIIGE